MNGAFGVSASSHNPRERRAPNGRGRESGAYEAFGGNHSLRAWRERGRTRRGTPARKLRGGRRGSRVCCVHRLGRCGGLSHARAGALCLEPFQHALDSTRRSRRCAAVSTSEVGGSSRNMNDINKIAKSKRCAVIYSWSCAPARTDAPRADPPEWMPPRAGGSGTPSPTRPLAPRGTLASSQVSPIYPPHARW